MNKVKKLIGIALCVFLIGTLFVFSNFFNHITLDIANHAVVFRIVRWCTVLIMVVFWRYFVCQLASKETIEYWLSNRISIALWLILFELLVCENIIFKLSQLI